MTVGNSSQNGISNQISSDLYFLSILLPEAITIPHSFATGLQSVQILFKNLSYFLD